MCDVEFEVGPRPTTNERGRARASGSTRPAISRFESRSPARGEAAEVDLAGGSAGEASGRAFSVVPRAPGGRWARVMKLGPGTGRKMGPGDETRAVRGVYITSRYRTPPRIRSSDFLSAGDQRHVHRPPLSPERASRRLTQDGYPPSAALSAS
jgi:hypothetical protein